MLDETLPLTPGDIYELDVEIWPTSVVVPAGHRVTRTFSMEVPVPALQRGRVLVRSIQACTVGVETPGAWRCRTALPFSIAGPLT